MHSKAACQLHGIRDVDQIKGLYPNSSTISTTPIASDCEVDCEVSCLVVVPALQYIVRGVSSSAVLKTEMTMVVGISIDVVETSTGTDISGIEGRGDNGGSGDDGDGGGDGGCDGDGGGDGGGDDSSGDDSSGDDGGGVGDIPKPYVTLAADQTISLSNSVIVVWVIIPFVIVFRRHLADYHRASPTPALDYGSDYFLLGVF
jgi:hypothetical protein